MKTYDYSEDIKVLQDSLKSIIDQAINEINPMEYNNYYKNFMYILVAFCDNLFIIHGPQEFHKLWLSLSMEKIYFNTMTSSYIFYQELLKIIESNKNTPEFMIYSYYLFFESLGSNHQFYTPMIKKFFQENIKKFQTKVLKDIKLNNYFHHSFLKINLFNLIFLLIFFIIIIFGNRYLYWQWLMNTII